jgi:ribonuclease HI
MFKIFTDGGSRGNPGKSAAGGVIYSPDGTILAEVSQYLGDNKTNNNAEYQGLILTLEKFLTLGLSGPCTVHLDSLLVVNQVLGLWKVNAPDLIPLHEKAQALVKKIGANIRHVPRNQNKIADALVNLALDNNIKS